MTDARRLKTTVSTLAAVAALAAGAGSPAAAQWDETYFPNVELVTQDGERVRFWDDLIRDKIVVVSFVYTDCPDICGLSTARLAQIAEWLGDRIGRDIFVYSISLDPETDTPDKLEAYAEAFGAPEGWTFLTGEPGDVDIIRHKLGERSRSLPEHRSDMVIGNAATGEWRRSSLMGSLVVATQDILALDPSWSRPPAAPNDAASETRPLLMGATPGEGLFLSACAACHSIGEGVRVGPDLAGVTLRRERAWLEAYLAAPERLLAQGDPVAASLDGAFPVVRMPNLRLNATDVADLLHYLEVQTELIGAAAAATVEASEQDHVAHHAARDGQDGAQAGGAPDHQH